MGERQTQMYCILQQHPPAGTKHRSVPSRLHSNVDPEVPAKVTLLSAFMFTRIVDDSITDIYMTGIFEESFALNFSLGGER